MTTNSANGRSIHWMCGIISQYFAIWQRIVTTVAVTIDCVVLRVVSLVWCRGGGHSAVSLGSWSAHSVSRQQDTVRITSQAKTNKKWKVKQIQIQRILVQTKIRKVANQELKIAMANLEENKEEKEARISMAPIGLLVPPITSFDVNIPLKPPKFANHLLNGQMLQHFIRTEKILNKHTRNMCALISALHIVMGHHGMLNHICYHTCEFKKKLENKKFVNRCTTYFDGYKCGKQQ